LHHRDPGDGALQIWSHPVPIGRDFAERKVRRDSRYPPRRADRLEQAEHQPAALLPVVAVAGGVLQYRPVPVDPFDRLGQEVVVLGGLQRDGDPGQLAELTGPHSGAVDHEFGLDVAARGADTGHGTAVLYETGDRDALDDPRAL